MFIVAILVKVAPYEILLACHDLWAALNWSWKCPATMLGRCEDDPSSKDHTALGQNQRKNWRRQFIIKVRTSAKLGGVNSLPMSESAPTLKASIHYKGQRKTWRRQFTANVRISANLEGVNSLPRTSAKLGGVNSLPMSEPAQNLKASIHYQGQNQRKNWRRQFTANVRISANLEGVNSLPMSGSTPNLEASICRQGQSRKIDEFQELGYEVLNEGKNEMALGFLEQWFFA
ncbi:hypothetical protein C8R48DRAFT_780435 [Suillus tomentosus]|nr:hypothetical protein C8R48DRAFT_780435 [Suillus tomentosus]